MTHFMAGTVGRHNIRVNAIAPGPTMTEATKQGVPEQYLQYIIDMQMAIHRALEPDDLTGTAVWLASDDSQMVTGQVIPVDGGMVMLGLMQRRWSASSWAPGPTGRRCAMPPRRSSSSACRTRCAWSRRIARPTCCSSTPARAEARGLEVLIAGAGGAAHLPGHGGGEDGAAGAGRAGRVGGAEGRRLAALHRADAGRRAGRDARDRTGGRRERRPPGGCDPGRQSTRRSAKRCAPFRVDADGGRAGRSGSEEEQVNIGVLGGGQLGRMLALAGYPLGHGFVFLDPAPEALGGLGEPSRGAARRRTTRSPSSRRASISSPTSSRTCPAAAARSAGRAGAGVSRRRRRSRCPRTGSREDVVRASSGSRRRRSPPIDSAETLAAAVERGRPCPRS